MRRIEEGNMLRRVADAPVAGTRRRVRQTSRWNDTCCRDVEKKVEGGIRNGQDQPEKNAKKKKIQGLYSRRVAVVHIIQ